MTESQTIDATQNKVDRLYEILEGKIDLGSPVVQSSTLNGLASQAVPKLIGPEEPLIRGALLACVGLLIVLALLFIEVIPELKIIAIAAVVIPIVDATFRAIHVQRTIRKHTIALYDPLNEVKEINRYLSEYLVSLDRRTSRYFHCVTNTKLTTYCVLRQIQMALEERIVEVEKLLRWPTAASVIEAYEVSKRLIFFRDGVVRDTGRLFSSPVERIRALLDQLIQELDSSLESFEADIAVLREQIN